MLNILLTLALLTISTPPLARALGHKGFGPDMLRRTAIPALEIYTHGALHRQRTPPINNTGALVLDPEVADQSDGVAVRVREG